MEWNNHSSTNWLGKNELMIILDLKSIHLSHKTVSFIAQALSICQCQRRGIVLSLQDVPNFSRAQHFKKITYRWRNCDSTNFNHEALMFAAALIWCLLQHWSEGIGLYIDKVFHSCKSRMIYFAEVSSQRFNKKSDILPQRRTGSGRAARCRK